MKKLTIVITLFSALAFAGVAFGEALAVGTFGNGEVDISLPGKAGYRLCIAGIQYDADTASDDITFYAEATDRARTWLTTDEAIGQTTMASSTTAAVSGISTTGEVILERANGAWAEWETLASFSNLAPTVGATDLPFYVGDSIKEVTSFMVFNNIGTAATDLTAERGLFCGPVNSGIVAVGSAGVWMEYMYGAYYREDDDRPVGWMEGVAANAVALPGKAGKRIVITEIGFDVNGVTDDINLYTWNGLTSSKTQFTADEAAGQTALTVKTDPGFNATSGYIIMERANGDYAEIQAFSNYATTTITATALQNAFRDGDNIYEAEVMLEWANQTAAAQIIENQYGLAVGPPGMSIGIVADNASSLIDYVAGYYEDAGAGRRTSAMVTADATAAGQVVGSHLALPGLAGKKTCVTAIQYNPTTASTDELKFYTAVQPFDSATLTADKAVGATALTWTSNQGADNFADTAMVVLQHPEGRYAEIGLLSAATATAATVAALSNAFPDGSLVFEMETNLGSYTMTDPVTDAAITISNAQGIFCGPVGSPVAVTLDGANSVIHYLSGYSE